MPPASSTRWRPVKTFPPSPGCEFREEESMSIPDTRSLSLHPIKRDAHTMGIPSGTHQVARAEHLLQQTGSSIAWMTKSTIGVGHSAKSLFVNLLLDQFDGLVHRDVIERHAKNGHTRPAPPPPPVPDTQTSLEPHRGI